MSNVYVNNCRVFSDDASVVPEITVSGEGIVINGIPVRLNDFGDDRVITIVVDGNVGKLNTGSSEVTVNGNVENVRTVSGDIKVGGSVIDYASTATGDISVTGSIAGTASTMSGDIRVRGDVGGDVLSKSGDIKR